MSKGGFFVRANIWLPIQAGKRTEQFEKRLYAYDLPHDHNFSFLTVGYFGPGYVTDIYQYDHSRCVGYLDEPVELEHQGRYQLIPGRIIEFRSGRDVHIQYVPESVSVSLNLLCRNPKSDWQQQYIFNLERSTVAGGAGDVLSNRLFVVEAAGAFGNAETISILSDLVDGFPCAKTKAIAVQAIARISPDEGERVLSCAPLGVRELSLLKIITGNYARSLTGG